MKSRLIVEAGSAADERIAASVHRLLADDYAVEPVLDDGVNGDWPGDWPGRLLMALTSLRRLTPDVAERLGELVSNLPARLNERGYFGPVHNGFDEQQLAGHGWLVSGLFSYADLAGDERAAAMARTIVENLYLPLLGYVGSYPVRSSCGSVTGGASGEIAVEVEHWKLSTDTYCVFIALEGLVAAYEHDIDPRVAALIEEFMGIVDRDDLVAEGAQLHATLTAARCLERYAAAEGSSKALTLAIRLYEWFRAYGQTLNHATLNWFGRLDSWTEPCAMVDAHLLAVGLWRTTGQPEYLDEALLIEANGLGHAQKPGGSFGLDSVTLPGQPWLENVEYDARWCCTMRGAVGLVEARLSGMRFESADTGLRLLLDNPHTLTALHRKGGKVVRVQVTATPVDGSTAICLLESDESLEVSMHMARWSGQISVSVDGRRVEHDEAAGRSVFRLHPGQSAVVTSPHRLRSEEGQSDDGEPFVRRYEGPFLLATMTGDDGESATSRISDVFSLSSDEALHFRARLTVDR